MRHIFMDPSILPFVFLSATASDLSFRMPTYFFFFFSSIRGMHQQSMCERGDLYCHWLGSWTVLLHMCRWLHWDLLPELGQSLHQWGEQLCCWRNIHLHQHWSWNLFLRLHCQLYWKWNVLHRYELIGHFVLICRN